MSKQITISGTSFHLGVSTLVIDVTGEDGHLIDTFRTESCSHSFEDLWEKFGRKPFRQLRDLYGVTSETRKPSSIRL